MVLAYLALGSNQGARREQLAQAVRALDALPGCRVVAVSDLYESEYLGPGRQPGYLNACLALETGLSPRELLRRGKDLERAAGRRQDSHMEPRPLDIDVLLLEDQRVDEPDLQIPHPRLAERRFVLQPLCDLDPQLVVPGAAATVLSLAQAREVRAQRLRSVASAGWWEEIKR